MKLKPLFALFALTLLSLSVSAYPSDYMNLMWNSTIKETMSGMDVGDINGDGFLEIFVSASAEGVVYAFGQTGEVVWKFAVPGYVNFVRAVDLNSDNQSEVLTGTSTHLYVINSSGDLLWKLYTQYENVENAEAFDLDGDGLKDVFFSATTGSCGGNILYSLNSTNAEVIWKYLSNFYYPNSIRFVKVDGEDVILLGMVLAPRSMGGCIPNFGKPANVVALNKKGEELWVFNTTGGVIDLKVSDVDNDGIEEIVVGSSQMVYVLNNKGGLKWDYDFEDSIDGIALASLRDGQERILAATYRAYLLESDGSDYWILNSSDRAYSVASGDLNDDQNPEYIVGSDRVYLYDYDRNLVWNSSRLVYVGYLFTGNFDNTPDVEIAVGADKRILVYKTGIRASLQKADVYYTRAQNLYNSGQYSSALHYALQAKDIYYQYQQDNGFRKTRSLIESINVKVNSSFVIELEADDYYNRSIYYYTSSDFMNASVDAQIAKAKYSLIGKWDGFNRSEEILNKSLEFLARNVSSFKQLAVEAQLAGESNLALEYAENAKLISLFLRDKDEADRIDLLIAEIKVTRKISFSERVQEFVDEHLQNPSIRKFLYPSGNPAFNLTIQLAYLIALLLVLVSVQFVLTWLYRRLTRKTLDLGSIPIKEDEKKE